MSEYKKVDHGKSEYGNNKQDRSGGLEKAEERMKEKMGEAIEKEDVAGMKEALYFFSGAGFSLLPTPIHKLSSLSDMLGCNVYCKRDDLTGFGFGGNKSRKLDFLLPYAKAQGADSLLAVGANQSNFCRMTAAFGSAWGMDVHLVLGGGEPAAPTGNLLVDHALGAEIHYVDSMVWDQWVDVSKEVQKTLEAEGRKVFRMPVGGSTPVGALGYVKFMLELMEDEERLGVQFSTLIHASSSAGTQAGLVVGKEMTRWPGKVVGMSVAKKSKILSAEVSELADKTSSVLGRGLSVKDEDIIVDDSYMGESYAARTTGCHEAMTLFARRCGIFLDRVYTGKAAAGLIDYAAKGLFEKDENVCFLHTGGNIEIFE